MKVLFYSSVADIKDFKRQGFYVEDTTILESLGYEVRCTNNIFEFLLSDYQIAFLYFYKWSVIPALIARLKSRRVFFTGGIDDLSDKIVTSILKRFIFKLLFIFNYLLANKINIISESDFLNVSTVLNAFRINVTSSKILVFPHSVQVNFNSNNSSIKVNHTFCSVCWMSTKGNVIRKGLDKAMKFFYLYCQYHPNSLFYVIGRVGEGTEYIKSLPYYKSVAQNVIFTDFLSDEQKFEILSSSIFYFQLSNYEGFGIAALEANLCKCFVLHSGSGGYLSSPDIWGAKVIESGKFNTELAHYFDYKEEISLYNQRYKNLSDKYSRKLRAKNINEMLSYEK
jgi:glycosyltransferase involved in cell wall biosynthesis